MKTAMLFPGQKAQFKGMSKKLFQQYPHLTEAASDILGYSITELCLQDTGKKRSKTEYIQPALYVVHALEYYNYIDNHNNPPDFVAGYGLGEYNALLAAGAFDFETGLRLVQKRGALMAGASTGGMLAVLNCEAAEIGNILIKHHLKEVDIASYDTATQTILSGPTECIKRAESILLNKKIRTIPCNINRAFHSRYMLPVQNEFEGFLKLFNFRTLSTTVIANVTGKPYPDSDAAALLIRQISAPVQWRDSICYLIEKGVEAFTVMGDSESLKKMIMEMQQKDAFSIGSGRHSDSGRAADGYDTIQTKNLGSAEFKESYGIKYAYYAGGMYQGISSKELVIAMGKAGMMGVLGTGGMTLEAVEKNILSIKSQLSAGEAYAVNLWCNIYHPEVELTTVQLLLKHHVSRVEATGFINLTPALVWYHASGLEQDGRGKVQRNHRIIAKLSHPDVAQVFMSPPPERILQGLLKEGKITPVQAELARQLPVSQDICVEADSGRHTDQRTITALFPSIRSLCIKIMEKYQYSEKIRIGLAGGIGTPEAAASAFVMGADFIVTGSINQCTAEAGTSATVKDMLQEMNVQDTDHTAAGDLFEIGARVQVLKKGVFFSARANKLYGLYKIYNSIDELPVQTRRQIEETYFKKSLDEVWQDIRRDYQARKRNVEIDNVECLPKQKMALIFRTYFKSATQSALSGEKEKQVDFQICTSPALGAFNQWVKGTELEQWQNRHVDKIAEKLMTETAALLTSCYRTLLIN